VKKPRLLIPISIQFSVRYILRSGLLDRLSDAAEPVILLDWRDRELEAELERKGAEVHFLIAAKTSPNYERVRSWLNLLHKKRLNTPSEIIWERRADIGRSAWNRLRRRARKRIFESLSLVAGGESWLRRKEQRLFDEETNASEVQKQIDALRLDAAFSITPFLANEQMALRACTRRNIPSCTSILSFDNITTRGWIPVPFDKYFLWNRYNAEELLRSYPEVSSSQVGIVGAPQFDFYWNPDFCWGEAEWRQRLGLPEGRPVILYGGGYHFCAQHEPRFLEQIDNAIERNEIPGNAVVLFRNHPVDAIERWHPVLKKAKHVILDDPNPGETAGRTNLTNHDIQRLTSTLCHSRVHVSVASTMSVDGAIFDRPQIGPAYDDSPRGKYDRTSQDLYYQEHYLPITHSGGLDIVRSEQELIAAIRDALVNPGRLAEGRKRMVREICTYDDGRATGRVADAVQGFLGSKAPVPEEVHAVRGR
jgi:hypothetical protein